MPLWAHRACGVFVYGVELGLPLLIWGPRRLRAAAFAGMVAMQVTVLATANYGFFNYLSMALALWLLDDGHFGRAAVAREPPRRPFVPPHQPRVDFQLWFLLLGPRPGARYFDALLARLLTAPEVVAPLFARDPFPAPPPRFVRVAIYRYRFTDVATRRATGAWWQRELEGRSRPLDAES